VSTPALPPAGWFPNPDDPSELRWWDGTAWTEHTAPPTAVVPANAPRTKGRIPIGTWIGIGLTALFALAAIPAGLGSVLIYIALIAGGTAVYTLITKRRGWALLPTSRPIAGAIAAGALVLLIAGSGMYSAAHPTQPALAAAAAQQTTATPTSTPSPTPSNTGEPLDPDTVVSADGAPSVAIANNSTTTATALDVLATIQVKGKAAATGYARTTQFGAAWLDVDHNGCDTRNDILYRDLTGVVQQGPCKILSGTLDDKYTGTSMDFVRGDKTSALVQIDHIVPLQDAWVTGAQQLTQAQRISLANDPLNLIAVDAKSNEQKSAGDAATWLPKNKAFRCEYVARQISVKATYGLWVTTAEHDAMASILSTCSGQMAESSTFTPAAPTPTPTPTPEAPAPAPAPSPEQQAPAPAPQAPAPQAPAAPEAPVTPGNGATALCNDGTYSYAAHHQGACSHHGGVSVFYK
jgi:hypothetical protein